MFLLKKVVSRLFFPLPVCLEILLIGLILLWFSRRQKAGKVLISLGVMLLLLLSNASFSNLFLRPLEERYPPLLWAAGNGAPRGLENVEFIVVLGGSASPDPEIPLESQLDEVTLVRLLEGIRLLRQMPGRKIILSGGKVFASIPSAELMARLAKELGVDRNDILVESESRDTSDEARLISSMVGPKPFILVTSASHMPRAMALFRKMGMNPFPAPTDYQARHEKRASPEAFYPDPGGLLSATIATYEYLGLGWEKLTGQI